MLSESANSVGVKGVDLPLGNNTKSSPPLNYPETSNYGAFSPKKPRKNSRALRYQLQDTARALVLDASDLPDEPTHRDYNRVHRVAKCRHVMVASRVSLHRSHEHGTAFWAGLHTCGSVWACPVCAGKIQERRREELAFAVDQAYKTGLTVSMVTLTFPHYAAQTCKELRQKQRLALQYFRKGKAFDKLKQKLGYVGLIRGLEVTHGRNGWHIHTHELWFHEKGRSKGMKAAIVEKWLNACSRAGLVPKGKITAFRKHAVDVRLGAQTGDYLAKSADQAYWGADSELARQSLKTSSKGRSPFSILEDADGGCYRSGALFLEYIRAFHGSRQLYWSPGLKARFDIEDKTDEALSHEEQDRADLLSTLDRISWRVIRLNKAREHVLCLAESGGLLAVEDWLRDHGCLPPSDSS